MFSLSPTVKRKNAIYTHLGVSPFRQSATSHLFRNYLFNGYRRLAAQLPYWVIPVGIGKRFLLSRDCCLTDVDGCEMYRLQRLRMG